MGVQHQLQFPDLVEHLGIRGGARVQLRHLLRQRVNALLEVHQIRKGGHGFINEPAPADMDALLGQIAHLGVPGLDDGPGIRFIKPGDALHQRGLARAVMARQGNSFPILNREGKVIKENARAILYAQILNSQNHVPEKQREEGSGRRG